MKKGFLIGIGLLIVGGVSAATISSVVIPPKTDRGIVTFSEFNTITQGLAVLTDVFNGVIGDLLEIRFGKRVVATEFVSTGGVRIGAVADVCGGTIEGELRYNSTEKYPEYCDGAAWAQISGGECFEKTCSELRHECGLIDDGCGTELDCGTCSEGFECFDGYCKSTCVARATCDDILPDCGWVDDGCGDAYNCGECIGGSSCINNFCVHPDEASWPATDDLWTERSGDVQCLFAGYKGCVSAIDNDRNPIPCAQKAVGGSAICQDALNEVEEGVAREEVGGTTSSGNMACASIGYTQCVKAIRETIGTLVRCDEEHYGTIVAGCANPSDTPMVTWTGDNKSGYTACAEQGLECLNAYNKDGTPGDCSSVVLSGYAKCSTAEKIVTWEGFEARSGDMECGLMGYTCDKSYQVQSSNLYAKPCAEVLVTPYSGLASCGGACTPITVCNPMLCGTVQSNGCGGTLNCSTCRNITYDSSVSGNSACSSAGHGACISTLLVLANSPRPCDYYSSLNSEAMTAICAPN